jgi:hypothetical protein
MDNDCKRRVIVKVFGACENLETSINCSAVCVLDYV